MNAQTSINGITVICPPNEIVSNPFIEIKKLGANWTSIVPFRNTETKDFKINQEDIFNWWGLSEEGTRQMIRMAKKQGLSVMLKPQLFLENKWPGVIDFEKSSDWAKWEKQYSQFIEMYLELAIEEKVDIFCIGTELKESVTKRPQFWIDLINKSKSKFKGKIIYAANWDNYKNISFWSELDYISLSAYFPVRKEGESLNPKKIEKKWDSILKDLKQFSYKKGKPILFTEYGYMSVIGTGSPHWLLEDKVTALEIAENEQAEMLNLLYQNLWEEKTWKGGFLWKWFPDKSGHQGYFKKDYTPQGKKAEKIILHWFHKERF